ncbi:MAG: polysaccharide deacetylase family protein [Phycisphaerae bacterium]|nr:polysaccharide deacetylase family protein [Phycisphaerae bacterium]
MISSPSAINAFTIDVESWFNILDIPSGPARSEWPRLEDRDSAPMRRLLDLLDRHGVRATCFVSGWTAQHRPGLLDEIVRRGHEVACHGYAHRLIYTMTPDRFREDLELAKTVIARVCDKPPLGYRAPGFSLTGRTPWAFRVIADAGFQYDSSVFPAPRGHGGIPGAARLPYFIEMPGNRYLREFPISVTKLLSSRTAYVGGGYLRLFPYRMIRRWMRRAHAAGEPVILYVHPRDIDPDQPRIPMPLKRRLKSYINLHTTLGKLDRLLTDFHWAPAVDVLDRVLPWSSAPRRFPTLQENATLGVERHEGDQRLRRATQLHEDRAAHEGLQGLQHDRARPRPHRTAL